MRTFVVQSIAWSFSQADIEQFRVNLTSCNELQLKCGLYTKSIFRQRMSQALLSLLLTVLLVRSHELCRDEIISTLFHILTNVNATDFVQSIQHHLEQSSTQAPISDQHKRLLLENYGRNEKVCIRQEVWLRRLSVHSRIYHHSHKISTISFTTIGTTPQSMLHELVHVQSNCVAFFPRPSLSLLFCIF